MDFAVVALFMLHLGVGVLAVLVAITGGRSPDTVATPPVRVAEAAAPPPAAGDPWPESPQARFDEALAAGDEKPAASPRIRGRVLVGPWRQWPEERGVTI